MEVEICSLRRNWTVVIAAAKADEAEIAQAAEKCAASQTFKASRILVSPLNMPLLRVEECRVKLGHEQCGLVVTCLTDY
jgi:hypothetical protein